MRACQKPVSQAGASGAYLAAVPQPAMRALPSAKHEAAAAQHHNVRHTGCHVHDRKCAPCHHGSRC